MGFLERLVTGESTLRNRGNYLVQNAYPLYCAKVTRENIAAHIKYLLEEPPDETLEEEALRERLSKDYVKVLEVMNDVVDACKRLYDLEYPVEGGQASGEDVAINPAVPVGVDRA